MAKKRMFSLDVVETDTFVDLPDSAQKLYFHLGMYGDDDGFISRPRMVARSVNCTDADLEILIKNGFLIRFDSGVIAIRDWYINNDLKNDRYRKTICSAEKAVLRFDSDKRYRLVSEDEEVCIRDCEDTETEHNVTQPNVTQPNITQPSKTERSPAEQNPEEEKNGDTAPPLPGCEDHGEAKPSGQDADKPPRPRFSPPKLEEVEEYCRERHNGIDAAHFVDFYTANGWSQGRGKPIRDWKAAVRTWEGREKHGRNDHRPGRDDTPIAGVTRF